jgi:GT2 family glycosyltransferase
MSRRIGLITVTYNSAAVLPDFLRSVSQCCHRSENDIRLYAVDNASNDDSVAQLMADGHTVTLPQDVNGGIAVGNNVGIRRALDEGCDYLLLINNDTYFSGGLIDELVAASEAHGQVAVVPLILATDPPQTVWFAGGEVQASRAFKAIHYGLGGAPQAGLAARPTSYAPTCCLLLPADVVRAVGLMDESFFLYGDDVDFCHRLRLAGHTPQFWPSSVLHHKAGSLTGSGRSEAAVTPETHARVLLSRKYLSRPGQARALAYLLTYSFARLITRRDPLKVCALRLRACVTGWRVPLLAPLRVPETPPSKDASAVSAALPLGASARLR